MLHIEINDPFGFIGLKQKKIISKIIEFISKNQKISKKLFFELNIVDLEKIHFLNFNYRHKDCPTDVISFSFWDATESIKTSLIGEVFICKEKVVLQAKEFNHSVDYELYFLIVHGVLHLLGYDHENESDKKKMFDLQDLILKQV